MGNENFDKNRQLEGLRLFRAFRRIGNAEQRALVINLAERLVHETPAVPTNSTSASTEGKTEGVPGDILD